MLSLPAACAARGTRCLCPWARLRPDIGTIATIIGYLLAANLSQTFGAAVLLLTPLAFTFSTARNVRGLADGLALGLGLAFYPIAAMLDSASISS